MANAINHRNPKANKLSTLFYTITVSICWIFGTWHVTIWKPPITAQGEEIIIQNSTAFLQVLNLLVGHMSWLVRPHFCLSFKNIFCLHQNAKPVFSYIVSIYSFSIYFFLQDYEGQKLAERLFHVVILFFAVSQMIIHLNVFC